jgi:hypothetical protein
MDTLGGAVARYRTLVAPEEDLSVARSADPHHTGHHPSSHPDAPADDREHVLFALQGSAGNRAVARLMEHRAEAAASPILPPVSHPESTAAGLEEPEPLAEFNELSEEEASAPPATPTAAPAGSTDVIGGETSGLTPAPVGPAHANAGDAVTHWPGEWRVGSLSIGLGTLVATVTWQKYRGRARHM